MRRTVGISALVLLTVPAPVRAADGLADLLGWVPARANAALFIDADAVQRSEMAVKGKWGTGNQHTLGLDSLPPNVSQLVVASQIDPGAGMAWEVMVAAQRRSVSEDDFIKRTGGTRDTVGGRSVILTERYGIVAKLAPGVAGAYQPPNRQEAGRWLRAANGKVAPDFSPYLRQAAAAAGLDAPVVLAFDTTDMLDPAVLKDRLGKATSLKGRADAGALANLLAGLKGVTVTVRVKDRMTAEMRLDFEKPADALEAVAKPFLLEVLERMGLHGEEMAGWAAAVRGNAVTFGGPIEQATVDLLLGPFLRPSASSVNPDEGSPMPDSKADASLKYFRAVDKKIRETRNSKNPNFAKLANTFNVAARQIDDLPILGVDEELLNWGNAVSATFRTMAIVAQTTGGQIRLLDANKAMVQVNTPNYYYGSGYGVAGGYWGAAGYGYNYALPSGTTSTSYASNYGQVANLQSMTNMQEAEYRMNTWKNLEAATTDVRRKMVKKYGVEF